MHRTANVAKKMMISWSVQLCMNGDSMVANYGRDRTSPQAARPVNSYISLAEYLWLAEQVTGVDAVVVPQGGAPGLADSALHALQAAFACEERWVLGIAHRATAVMFCGSWCAADPSREPAARLRRSPQRAAVTGEPEPPQPNPPIAAMEATAQAIFKSPPVGFHL